MTARRKLVEKGGGQTAPVMLLSITSCACFLPAEIKTEKSEREVHQQTRLLLTTKALLESLQVVLGRHILHLL